MNTLMAAAAAVLAALILYIYTRKPAAKVITTSELKEQLAGNDKPLLIDVRTPAEFNAGHIKGAVSAPLDTIETAIEKIAPQKDAYFVVYCHSGSRSAAASGILKRKGYTNFKNFSGSVTEWLNQGNTLVQ